MKPSHFTGRYLGVLLAFFLEPSQAGTARAFCFYVRHNNARCVLYLV
jgi:hypothetical protein